MTRSGPPQDRDAAWLDALLDDVGRTPPPAVSDDLMARVMADAVAALPAPGGAPAPVPIWRQVVEGLGGWSAIGGLVAATVTGFAVGLGALDTAGADAIWSLGSEMSLDSEAGLNAYGWDLEES
ncbi:MAG: hypothetical protein AAFQ19_05725 [Pseudomonadota bacterium]